MIEMISTFKDRLNECLELRGMNGRDLAKRAKLSEPTISQYRSGYAKPKEDRLALIASVLDVNPVWLMGLNVPMNIEPKNADLTQDEKDLIRMFRQLSDEQKTMIIMTVKAARDMNKGNADRASAS